MATLNRIILIGNGFDLAHGLKTGYKDFINNFCEKLKSDTNLWNSVMDTKKTESVNFEDEKFINNASNFRNKFFQALKSDLSTHPNWVDVEKVYYKQLVKCMEYELNTSKPKYLIKDLNQEFGFFEKKLEEYLFKEFSDHYPDMETKPSIEGHLNKEKYNKTLIVNFNYTSTDKKYALKIKTGDEIIRLHGELKNPDNPMIFGYGDELAKNYKEIEELDNNEYLEYVKSIKYSLTEHYNNLWDFINNGGAYHIYLFGLSCGNSDRTLLNELFEHKNCEKIKIFYWQKSDMSDNFLEIYKNISRIFTKKNNLRNIVATKPQSEPLVPFDDLQAFLDENFVFLNDNRHRFYISRFLVTQEQFESRMGSNPSYFKGAQLPVESVSWYDATEFCNRLSIAFKLQERYIKKNGQLEENTAIKGFRLPTEAEWEYAARGGNKSSNFIYSGSNDVNEVAWYSKNSGSTTHPVGKLKPNELGIYDMSGNVWEWCEDWYDARRAVRVLRGGSWGDRAGHCAVSYRNCNSPGNRIFDIGFRLVLPQ